MKITRLTLITLLFTLPGCTGGLHEPCAGEVRFLINVDEKNECGDTRSVLPETTDFENAVNDLTLLVYDSATGNIEAAEYTSGKGCSIILSTRKAHSVYAFANMGDLTSQAPSNFRDIGLIKYTIPSFEAISSHGLPMAGNILSPAGSRDISLTVRRLVAKMIITVDHSDMNSAGADRAFAGGSVRVHRAARTLYPFAEGGSAAREDEDVFRDVTDHETVTEAFAPVSEELTLYIPENMQKDIPAGSSAGTDADEGLCTYISFNGSKVGIEDGVDGNFVYRFFPGTGNAENPGLEGGKVYHTRLSLTWEGMYINGEWKVERSSWSDRRHISISASPDRNYTTIATLNIPPGVRNYPYYIFYTINRENYSSHPAGGKSGHRNYGWRFSCEGMTSQDCNSSLKLSGGITCGFAADETLRSRHCVTIPPNQSLIGTTKTIIYHTSDKRHQCILRINIAKPSIILDRDVVVCSWNEYSDSGRFRISVSGGNVPLSDINVSCSDPFIRIETYNPSDGTADCCWTGPNENNIQRKATISFTGLGASASCTVHQNGRSALSVDVDENLGSGNIEF